MFSVWECVKSESAIVSLLLTRLSDGIKKLSATEKHWSIEELHGKDNIIYKLGDGCNYF